MMFGGEEDFDDTPKASKPDFRADARALLVWGGALALCAALVLGQVLAERAPEAPSATRVAEAD